MTLVFLYIFLSDNYRLHIRDKFFCISNSDKNTDNFDR